MTNILNPELGNPPSNLCGLTFMTQNLNSLNVSTANKNNAKVSHFKQKISAILSKKCDIIFLQDVRAASKLITIEKIITCTMFGNYKLIANSTLSKRGVCILYKRTLDLEVLSEFHSPCQNLLLVKCNLNNVLTCLGSAYGPRDADNPNFMTYVRQKVHEMNTNCHLVAGDFNCLTSNLPIIHERITQAPNKYKYRGSNPDCLNMQNIPNISNTNAVCEGIADGFWTDPFRSLYPNRRDYSYVPFNKNAPNRSRIDFFLISPNLLSFVEDVKHEPLLTKLFDHKAVILNLNLKNTKSEPRIDNKYVKYPGMREESALIAFQLFHASTNVDLSATIRDLTQVVNDLKMIVIYKAKLLRPDLLINQYCTNLVEQCTNIINLTYQWDDLSAANCIHEPDLLFETLQNNVKMAIISFQTAIKKSEKCFEKNINHQLNLLKNSEDSLACDVFELEARLNEYYDEINLVNCEKNKYWSLFHLERPTSNYCNLTKASNKLSSLDNIKDTSNKPIISDFNSNTERNTYIKRYFEDIYKTTGPRTISIEQFLGDQTLNSDHVTNKILSEEERQSIEGDISIPELTDSLNRANLGSAAGCDGWSYKAIKYHWDLFKHPLCKGFNFMTHKRRLGYSFSRVQIKLLPKKGSNEDIKNYRPISLLSNFYKLCSSSFNQRMLKFANKITSIKQKAYSKTKVGHEGVINILDNIKKAIDNNANLAIILVDFSKAFDMLEHEFIENSFKFFGFGPDMLRILKTIITGRMGGIITKEGLTELFNFLSGNGQGDSSSATIFIFCLEFLLIRLKLDPRLERIVIDDPRSTTGLETLETSGYADDISEFVNASAENLETIKLIFNEFFLLSGLELNKSKTTVIPVAAADNQDFKLKVLRAGFNCESEFTVLGFLIDNKLEKLHRNIDKITTKMSNIANFWDKIHMSLIGRITVAKTFLLSQISYFCTILPTRRSDFRNFDKLIANFITKKTKISNNLVFIPVNKGGLGMFNTFEFIQGIRLGLFKRSLKSKDSWAEAIKASRFNENSQFQLNINHDSLTRNPTARLIAGSINDFNNKFFLQEGNVLKAPIFNNINVFRKYCGSPLRLEDINLETRVASAKKLIQLRPFDILNLNTLEILPLRVIEQRQGLALTIADYGTISTFMEQNVYRLRRNFNSPCTSLTTFFDSIKKGSKKFRNILLSEQKTNFLKSHSGLKKRLTLISELYNNQIELCVRRDESFFSVFNQNIIPTIFRTNFFNLLNNYTMLNGQISHFDENINPSCSFCRTANINNPPTETIAHFILNCTPFSDYINYLYEIITPESSRIEQKKIFYLGQNTSNIAFNTFTNICTALLWNFLYFRRKCSFPITQVLVVEFIVNHLRIAATASSGFQRTLIKSRKLNINILNGFEI